MVDWKEEYASEWVPGAGRVEHVLKVLRKRFPELSIEPTEYALETGYIQYDAHHKRHEPDIWVEQEKVICGVEVTGSNIEMSPDKDIFILKGKYLAAKKRRKEEGVETWFYTVYDGSEFVLDIDLIKRFNGDKAKPKRFYSRSQELYIEIPVKEAYSREKLFKWIDERIQK